MMEITQIVTAVIALLGAVITSVILPLIKAKTTAKEQEIIKTVARTAVCAAQQILVDNSQKKAYAINYVGELLAKKNIKLSVNEISASVEAALKEIKAETDIEKW